MKLRKLFPSFGIHSLRVETEFGAVLFSTGCMWSNAASNNRRLKAKIWDGWMGFIHHRRRYQTSRRQHQENQFESVAALLDQSAPIS